ncbi:MAG: ATP-binding protein [Leptonema sp. (in: Bacteria)]|nr:ATP-binding protein [Leptonema sp. (in: bacteria)]
MSDVRPNEIDFITAKQQIETELDKIGTLIELPRIVFEKGELKITFHPPVLEKHQIFDALMIIKSCIEHIRIHTMEPSFAVFQSLGSNLFETKSFTSGIKFKFVDIGSPRIEITRLGNLIQEEIQAIVLVFKLFCETKKQINPATILARLGATISGLGQESKSELTETWQSISGYEPTKQEVQETVLMPLSHPEIFHQVSQLSRGAGAGLPRAVLFEGPPGVGKTTMARILAKESGLPLVYVGVENILSKYYGESAQNLSAIFDACAAFERAILFLDEIDSLAGSRDDGLIEATRRVLSVLLRKIDGFDSKPGILTIAATNRAADLDRALLSRFDTIIRFPMPNSNERAAILRQYIHHLPDQELVKLAELAEGLSGRNLKDICQMAERRWARNLILKQEPVSPPPVNLYSELIQDKINDNEWLKLG